LNDSQDSIQGQGNQLEHRQSPAISGGNKQAMRSKAIIISSQMTTRRRKG